MVVPFFWDLSQNRVLSHIFVSVIVLFAIISDYRKYLLLPRSNDNIGVVSVASLPCLLAISSGTKYMEVSFHH